MSDGSYHPLGLIDWFTLLPDSFDGKICTNQMFLCEQNLTHFGEGDHINQKMIACILTSH